MTAAQQPVVFKKVSGGVYRAYINGEVIPICPHCGNRFGCDFKRDDLGGCDSFSKITSGRIR